MHRVLTEQPHRTIIFAHDASDTAIFVSPSGPMHFMSLGSSTGSGTSLSLLNQARGLGQEPLVIADATVPCVLPFATLVVCDQWNLAKRDNRGYLKEYDAPHYMPLPTEQEVLDLHALAFPELDITGVRRRLRLWGPIPDLVLGRRTHTQSQLAAFNVARWIPLNTLADVARGSVVPTGDEVVHTRCLGQDAPPGSQDADPTDPMHYAQGEKVIGSLPLLRLIAQRARAEKHWQRAEAVEKSLGVGPLAAIPQLTFRRIVAQMLRRGYQFKCRTLADRRFYLSTGDKPDPLLAVCPQPTLSSGGAPPT